MAKPPPPAEAPPPPPPDPRVIERQRLREHIPKDPAFKVTTVDTLNWICPYTLLVVPAPFDLLETAVESLMERRPWTAGGKPKSHAELQQVRWNMWLREHLPTEPRLRMFTEDGRWLNPFTGDLLTGLPQTPPLALLESLTTVLASCSPAQGGTLLPSLRLDEIFRKHRNSPRASDEIAPPTSTRSNPIGDRPGHVPTLGPASGITQTTRIQPVQQAPPPPVPAATDLHRASQIIERMLPATPEWPAYTLAVHYEPMQDIGGDFYDFIKLADDRWLIILGDVSGHGPEGALVVSAGLKALRMLAPVHKDDLVGLLVALNDNLRPDLPPGFFLTCWAAIFDLKKRTLVTICAGHHPALLCSLVRPITLQLVGQRGAAIGVMNGSTLRSTLKPDHVQLRNGDLLLQCTDGLFEVHNPQGVEFGRLRCMGSCIANLEHPPAMMINRMVREIRKFAGGASLEDDLTVLALATLADKQE
jgi:serine phosphatase RsbU (regulator of sigma subunit)